MDSPLATPPEAHRGTHIAGTMGDILDNVEILAPATPEEVAQIIANADRDGKRVGRDFKLSLEHLNRILQYNADDLTVSVEAGLLLSELNDTLAQHKQW